MNGSSVQTVAYVTEGVEIYLPKNTYTKEGFVLYGWSEAKEPTSTDTIYLAGAPYLVNENITIYAVWKREGSGDVQTPIIKTGKNYNEITGGTNIMLTQASAFTAQMSVLNMQPNYYKDRKIIFNENLPNGTNITMLDLTNVNNKTYYSYKVANDETKEIVLTEFIKNGSNEKYVNPTGTEEINEVILFIVELPKSNAKTGARQMTFRKEAADDDVAPIEQSVTYTTTEKRKFEISYNENA